MARKILSLSILIFLFISLSSSNENLIYKVKKLNGTAQVRHGAKETWETLSVGDTLRPYDTIFLEKNSYIEIAGNGTFFKSNGAIVVNISDLRRLTKEELLLQLAFEEMKVSPEVKRGKPSVKSTGIYGADVEKGKTALNSGWNLAKFWSSGVRALFENGFYETASIRAKDLMSRFDELKDDLELKMIIATSLEKLELYGEAISEFNKIISTSKDANLNLKIERKIQELKSKLASLKEKR